MITFIPSVATVFLAVEAGAFAMGGAQSDEAVVSCQGVQAEDTVTESTATSPKSPEISPPRTSEPVAPGSSQAPAGATVPVWRPGEGYIVVPDLKRSSR